MMCVKLWISFCLPLVVLSQISISQSPNPGFIGQDVTVTCTAIEGSPPSLVHWNVDGVPYSIDFGACTKFGTIPYTPSGCSTAGTTHTANMTIAGATASENGTSWSCSTFASSNSINLAVQAVKIIISQDPHPAKFDGDLSIICTMNGRVPDYVDWIIKGGDSDSFRVNFKTCKYEVKKNQPYTPICDSPKVNQHTVTLKIPSVGESEENNSWKCSTAFNSSDPLTPVFEEIGGSELETWQIVFIVIGVIAGLGVIGLVVFLVHKGKIGNCKK